MAVIRKVTRNFVPVALNLYKIRKAKGPGGDFFRAVEKQRPKQYQGLYAVSPEGKVLSTQDRFLERGPWVRAVRQTIDEALEAFGPVTPRDPEPADLCPDRGRGVRKDGGIVLAVYTRPMLFGLERRGLGEVVIDSAALTEDERLSLTLDEFHPESRWTVPAATVRALHRVLSHTSDSSNLARRDEVARASLTGRVVRIRRGIAYLRYSGTLVGAHVWPHGANKGKVVRAEVTFVGAGTALAKTGKLLSLTLVGDGRYLGSAPYRDVIRYGAVVEWRGKK